MVLQEGQADACLAVFDHRRGAIVQRIPLPARFVMAVDLSSDGQFVAAGFWEEQPQVRIWAVESGELVRSFRSFGVSGIYFDKTSRYIIYKSEHGTYVKEVLGDANQQIRYAEDVRTGSFCVGSNIFWVPLKRKGALVSLTFSPLVQQHFQLPITTVIGQICHSPTTESFFVLDGKKTVYGFERHVNNPLWSVNLQGHAPDCYVTYGQYCGNGTLIGMTAVGHSKISKIVLHADTGKVQGMIEDIDGYEQPFAETEVLSMRGGASLDLATGERRVGLSQLVA